MLSIVVAISSNNVIGKDGKLPWYLPNDLKRFKDITTGHTIIMGRKTLNSLPNVLPNRHHIVLTRDKNFVSQDERVTVIHSIEELLQKIDDNEEYFVIGGGDVFRTLINKIDRIYLTIIHKEFDGDVFFPEIDFDKWNIISEEKGTIDDKNKYPHTFLTLDRIK